MCAKRLAVATPAMTASSASNDRLHKAALICHRYRISRAGSRGFRRDMCPCRFRKSSPPSLAAYWDHGGRFNYSLKLGGPATECGAFFFAELVNEIVPRLHVASSRDMA